MVGPTGPNDPNGGQNTFDPNQDIHANNEFFHPDPNMSNDQLIEYANKAEEIANDLQEKLIEDLQTIKDMLQDPTDLSNIKKLLDSVTDSDTQEGIDPEESAEDKAKRKVHEAEKKIMQIFETTNRTRNLQYGHQGMGARQAGDVPFVNAGMEACCNKLKSIKDDMDNKSPEELLGDLDKLLEELVKHETAADREEKKTRSDEYVKIEKEQQKNKKESPVFVGMLRNRTSSTLDGSTTESGNDPSEDSSSYKSNIKDHPYYVDKEPPKEPG